MLRAAEQIGRSTIRGLDELGYATALLVESLAWVVVGPAKRQVVRFSAVVGQMMQVGIQALPIATLLAGTIGFMLAIQALYSLGIFGAESFAHIGIGLSIVREFAPLIVAILVAGRSGSALAARLSSMRINQEIDALEVIGIHPVRFLVAPPLLAMVVMVPALTVWAMFVSLTTAGLYVTAQLDLSLTAYAVAVSDVVSPGDIYHGLGKSVLFGVLIAVIGVLNGITAGGGAEGVGRATTRSVVHCVSAVVFTDMIFAFVVSR